MKAWVLLRLLMQSCLLFLRECLTWKVMDSMLLKAGNFGSNVWPLWAVKYKPSHTQTGFDPSIPGTQVCTSAVGQAAHCSWLTSSHLQTKFQSLYRCFFHTFGHWYKWWFCKVGLFFFFIFHLSLQLCLKDSIDIELKNLLWCKVTKGWLCLVYFV